MGTKPKAKRKKPSSWAVIVSDGAAIIGDKRTLGEVECHVSLWAEKGSIRGSGWIAGEPDVITAADKARRVWLVFGLDRVEIEVDHVEGSAADFLLYGPIPERLIERWKNKAAS